MWPHFIRFTQKNVFKSMAARLITVFLLIPGVSSAKQPFSINQWHELVVSVSNFDHYEDFFVEIAEWRVVEKGALSREKLDAWLLPESATGEYRVYQNPGTERGLVQLVKFSGVEQVLMRPDSQSWDTGGIYDFNVRVKDLDAVTKKMRRSGWQARAPVTAFEFGPYKVKEWLAYNLDGVVIAMIERLEPELKGWPAFKSISRTFNATQTVADMDQALWFYEKVLGFERYLEHYAPSKEEGPNVLGLPQNLTDDIAREVVILSPDGSNEGSIELLRFEGAVGHDYSTLSNFPNLGIGLIRFSVENIESLEQHLQQHNVDWAQRLSKRIKTMIVRTPEGAAIEFYESK